MRLFGVEVLVRDWMPKDAIAVVRPIERLVVVDPRESVPPVGKQVSPENPASIQSDSEPNPGG